MFKIEQTYMNQPISVFDLTEESISESQNFQLQLSCASSENSTSNTAGKPAMKTEADNIIVLSDSSPSDSSSPKLIVHQQYRVDEKTKDANDVYILESSDCDSDKEHEKFFHAWKASKQFRSTTRKKRETEYLTDSFRQNDAWYTSDESTRDNSQNSRKQSSDNSNRSNSTHVSPSQDIKDKANCITKSFSRLGRNHFNDASSQSSTNSNSKMPNQNCTPTRTVLNSLLDNNNSTTKKLTKQKVHDILRNIKSTKAIYESPRVQEPDVVIADDSIEENLHPAISPSNKLAAHVAVISETPPDSRTTASSFCDDNAQQLPEIKTKIPAYFPNIEIDNRGLSARKKKQISEWLLKSSPDVASDSSMSHVPPSSRASLSSGNSSLERLEMNYETPNNRGRIPKVQKGKETDNYECNTKLTYTVIDNKNDKQDSLKHRSNDYLFDQLLKARHNNITPLNETNINKDKKIDRIRNKKPLPISEPREPKTFIKSRIVHTERKTKTKRNNWIEDSDASNDSETCDALLESDIGTKTVRRTKKKNDSFIKDSTSESDEESLYHTALTNPGRPKNRKPKSQSSNPTIQKVQAICDPDTSDEDNKTSDRQEKTIYRRKLEYSSDEDDRKSSTSEFDPGDSVPPKLVPKREISGKPSKLVADRKPFSQNRKSSTSDFDTADDVPSKLVSKSETNDNPPKQTIGRKPFSNKQLHAEHSFLASLSMQVPLSQAHPDAKKYRLNYKDNKDVLAKYLYKLYNENIFDERLPKDMSIEWNVRMRGTAGFCYNKKSIKALGGVVRSSRIVLATKILDTPDRLRDTLVHEMCHAAAWLINGVSDGHGSFWTAWANRAMKTFPELPPIRRCHDYQINTKFTYKCTGCGYSIGRHSKSLDVEKKRCGHCYGKFELLVNKTTKAGTVQVQTPKREPSAFALFVKQNYGSLKKEGNLKHGEVMKVLGQQFSAIKIAKQPANKENLPTTHR